MPSFRDVDIIKCWKANYNPVVLQNAEHYCTRSWYKFILNLIKITTALSILYFTYTFHFLQLVPFVQPTYSIVFVLEVIDWFLLIIPHVRKRVRTS